MSATKQKAPVDFWSKLRSSKSFRERTILSKYSRWAQDLTEEHFMGLLWAVGEYGYRSYKPLEILRPLVPKDDQSFARAMVALEILAEFAAGRPSTEDQVTERVRKAVADAQVVMFRNEVCAQRLKLKDLEDFPQCSGKQVLFDLLFSAFTQSPPVPTADQQTLGGYLRKLKPRGRQRLASLVRASLKGWDTSIQQLPLYFREVYGMEPLRLALDRLSLDASLSHWEW
ncbi:MAG: hypothetical protein NT154_38555 [Verrucomicrobia bacterium]|nr:hypothetical protein [Verrucomicrobiota bacterium]